jgi:pimeloyl-ACP methyl ester carboxylesterase
LSQGCAVAVEFAVRYPERVSKLILYGGYAQGWRKHPERKLDAQADALITLTRTGWGRDNPAFRQIFTSLFIPGATQEQMDWFNELQRITTSPENAATILESHAMIDVMDRLPLVKQPTLVLHVRNESCVRYPNGKQIAMGIPGATFVTLEGQNHLLLEQEPAWPRFLAEVRAFLRD